MREMCGEWWWKAREPARSAVPEPCAARTHEKAERAAGRPQLAGLPGLTGAQSKKNHGGAAWGAS